MLIYNPAGKSVCSVYSGQERDGRETHPGPENGKWKKHEAV